MKLVIWLAVHAAALGVAIWLFDGISLHAPNNVDFLIQLLITGAIFGIVSSFVKPILKLLGLPLIVVTLGLFLLVINALMLLLTSKLADAVGTNFHVDGFWTAVFGAIVISIAGWVLSAILPDGE